jgi:hypothetical protein
MILRPLFEIEHLTMSTEIRCRNCRASLTIYSDSLPLVTRSVSTFEKRHRCREIRPTGKGYGQQGQILREPENG